MATFYATIEGNRQPKTCGGSNKSGIRASAQSWNGSVITSLSYNDKNELIVRVGTNDYSNCYTGWGNAFYGTFKEFKDLLSLWCDIKNGRVRVIHHRQNKR